MDDKFVVFCSEKSGSAERRTRALADHLKHHESTMDRISLAAALKDEDGRPAGLCFISTPQVRMNKNSLLNQN